LNRSPIGTEVMRDVVIAVDSSTETVQSQRPADKVVKGRLLVFISEDFYFLSHRKELLLGLQSAGYDVTLATNLSDKKSEVEKTGIPAIHVNLESSDHSAFTFFHKVLEYAKIIKRAKPDIIFAVALKPVVTAAAATCFSTATPALFAFAGMGVTFSENNKSLRLRFIRKCFEATFKFLINRPSRFCLFQNNDDLQLFVEHHWTKKEKCFVIQGAGVDVENYPRKKWPPRQPVRFVFVGRLSWEKGLLYLFEACRILKEKKVNFECQVVGFFDKTKIYAVPLEELQRHDKAGIIRWLGPRSDVPSLLTQADCFVFPSVYREGVPRVLLEACAAGIPSITTNNVGCKEVIDHEVDGWIVPPRDSIALADAMQRAVENPELLQRFGHNARAKALDRFTLDQVVSAHLAILDRIQSELPVQPQP
jgi:glycosyltransferase involved in cell wall biosynthesis